MLMCGVSSVPPSGLSVRVYVYPHSTSTAGQCPVRVVSPRSQCIVTMVHGARSRSAGRPSSARTHCAAQPTWCQMPAPTPRDPGRAPIKVRHLPAGLLIRGSASPSVTDGRKTPPCTRQAIPSRAWGCWSCWVCVRGCDCPWGRSGSCRGPACQAKAVQDTPRHAACGRNQALYNTLIIAASRSAIVSDLQGDCRGSGLLVDNLVQWVGRHCRGHPLPFIEHGPSVGILNGGVKPPLRRAAFICQSARLRCLRLCVVCCVF